MKRIQGKITEREEIKGDMTKGGEKELRMVNWNKKRETKEN